MFFGLFLLLSCVAGQAKDLSLAEAVSLGLQSGRQLQIARSQVTQAKETYRQYVGGLFPRIDLIGSGVRQADSVTFAGLNPTSSISTDREIYSAYFSLAQPLYSGGAISSGLRLGRLNQEYSEQNYFSAKQSRVVEVVDLYYSLAREEARLLAAEENRKILGAYLNITRRYEGIGRARRMDRLQAESNYELSEIDLEESRSRVNDLRIRLVETLDLSVDQAQSLVLSTNFELQPLTPMTFESAWEQVKKNYPEYQMKLLNVERVKAESVIDFASDRPSLELRGELGYSSTDRERLFDDTSEYNRFGIYLTVPVFSGLSSISKRKVHRETEFQAQKDLSLTELDLRVALKEHLDRVAKSYGLALVAQKASRQSQDALKEANSGYSRGLATSQDVISFQRSRFDARNKEITANFAYLQGLLKLRQTLGIDLEKTYAN